VHPYPSGPPVATVADLSETELLARIFPLLAPASATIVGPGDDAAVVASSDRRTVVSTDVLVEDRHFRREWSSGYDVGWRAAMQNVADVAAMGAVPTALVVALVLPREVEVRWVEDLARGLSDAAAPWGAGVVGGDLSGGLSTVVAVTVHGSLEGREPVLRSGAQPGDVVVHAGARGRSAAGLAALTGGLGRAAAFDLARTGYLRPVAAVDSGLACARAGARAMIDVSDGLVRDAGRLAAASGVTLALDEPLEVFADEAAVLAPLAEALGDPGLVRTWILTGGEDHGMLATLPPGVELPAGFRRIGEVVERAEHEVLVAGEAAPRGGGWDHFGGAARR